MRLDGKVALITGGGRGIGRAIAQRLAEAGARVVVLGRTRGELEAAAADVRGLTIVADLGDRAELSRALGELEAEVGRIDILVNNAGVADSAPLSRTSDAMWDTLFAVNVTAPFVLCRALVPAMIDAGWGRVVNVASNAGLTGYAYTSAYVASKHALVGLTRALAAELARTGVTVNAVCPGWARTRMMEETKARISSKTGRGPDQAERALLATTPQGRLVEPAEVAHVVAMLCADAARAVHGQAIPIDGGQVMT